MKLKNVMAENLFKDLIQALATSENRHSLIEAELDDVEIFTTVFSFKSESCDRYLFVSNAPTVEGVVAELEKEWYLGEDWHEVEQWTSNLPEYKHSKLRQAVGVIAEGNIDDNP